MSVDWKKAKRDYVCSNMSMRAVAAKYGISSTAVGRTAKADGWAEERKKHRDKTYTRVIQKDIENRVKAHEEAEKIANRALLNIMTRLERAAEQSSDVKLTDKAVEERMVRNADGKKSKLTTTVESVRFEKSDKENEARLAKIAQAIIMISDHLAQPNSTAEDVENDGLLEQLQKTAPEIFTSGDDSAMLPAPEAT